MQCMLRAECIIRMHRQHLQHSAAGCSFELGPLSESYSIHTALAQGIVVTIILLTVRPL
jgi:hypothetical protein